MLRVLLFSKKGILRVKRHIFVRVPNSKNMAEFDGIKILASWEHCFEKDITVLYSTFLDDIRKYCNVQTMLFL
jgi:hypothetical protein